MGVILTHNLAHTVGRLFMRFVACIAHDIHTEQHTALYRFKAVSGIGERSRHNYGHRIVDVRALHFVLYINFYDTVVVF